MRTLIGDIRFAARMLLGNPAVAAVAVLTLALGTGANSAIFSVVYAVLLRPLPVRDAEKLITVAMASEKLRVTGAQPSFDFYEKCRRYGRFYDSIASAAPGTAVFAAEGETTVKFWRVSATFLPTLGVPPMLGRNFLPEEDQPARARVAILANSFWRGHLSGDPHVLGSRIQMDGETYMIIGVLPPGFHVDGRPADVYVPMGRGSKPQQEFPVNIYARLKPGVSVEQAQAEIDASTKLEGGGPLAWHARVWKLRDFQVRNLRLALWVLLAAVGLVLLIACANTATLLVANASARRKEIATRAALGAGAGRLLRQLLTESTLLSLAGGACGVLVARAAVCLVPLLAHSRLPGLLEQTRVDGAVLAFTMLIALATGVLFGVAPAVAALRGEPFEALKESGRSESPGRRRGWRALVIGETALALVLAIGATLLIRTFFYLRDVAPGFRVDQLLTVRITPPRGKFTSRVQCNTYWTNIISALRAIPGVQAASFAQALPLTGDSWVGAWPIEGVNFAHPREIPPMWQYFVDADYFRTMQIPLRRGRFFDRRDDAGAPKVVIVNEAFVRRFWPGQNAIGKHIGGGEDPRMEVIGVVADVSAEESTKSAPPELYFHFLQMPTARIAAAIRVDPRVFARPAVLEPAVRRAIHLVDPSRPPLQFAEMQRIISDRIAPHRLSAQLIAIFAGLALVLAAVGIYGVLSFSVAERTHEIGLRMALGAERRNVLRLIVGEAAVLASCGIAIGLAGALALTRLMRALLFGVGASDPVTYLGASAALLVIAVAAAAIPASRATRIDPMACLRQG
jgi:putative ABC transport system permease protein